MRLMNKLIEPKKRREIVLLSTVRRSNSAVWKPKEIRTIHNLWEDTTRLSLMDRLINRIGSPAVSLNSPQQQTNVALP